MKIVHLNDSDAGGGAANAGARLHAALTHLGIDSQMMVRHRSAAANGLAVVRTRGDGEDMFPYVRGAIGRQYGERNRTGLTNTHFSFYIDGAELSGEEPAKSADIVHLHWTASFQMPADVLALLKQKPLVWTLHDLAPLTGGCHFPAGCEGYTNECRTCPQLARDPFSITATTLRDKKTLWAGRRMTFVAPSRWIAHLAQRSAINRSAHATIVHIPYGIDTGVFRPHPKALARRKLGLPEDGLYVLCGANHNAENRKGLGLLNGVLARCGSDPALASAAVNVVSVGEPTLKLDDIGAFKVHNLRRIVGDDRMALTYAAADVFLLPSLEDNLPCMLLESLACGTPVVAFDVGGVAEVLDDEGYGRLLTAGDEVAMSAALSALLSDPDRLERARPHCREHIAKHFGAADMARRHAELYDELTQGHRAHRHARSQTIVNRAIANGAGSGIADLLPQWGAWCLAREAAAMDERVSALNEESRRKSDSIADDNKVREQQAEIAWLRRLAAERQASVEALEREAKARADEANRLKAAMEEQLGEIALVHRVAAEREALIEVLQRAAQELERGEGASAAIERQQAEIRLLQEVAAERSKVIEVLQSAAQERVELIDRLTAAIDEQRTRIADAEEALAARGFARLRRAAGKFARLIRLRHWWSQKIPPLLAVAYLELLRRNVPPVTALATICVFVLCVSSAAAYGHVLNDWCDIATDEAAGKPNPARNLTRNQRSILCAILAVAGFVLLAPLSQAWSARAVLALNLLWPTLYSIPGVRLKERGLLGVLADAAGSHITPTIFAFTLVDAFFPAPANPLVVAAVLLWATTLGIKGILYHQIGDRSNDEKSGVTTFVAAFDLRRLTAALTAYNVLFELPVSMMLVAVVAAFCPLAVAAIGLYLLFESTKSLLGFEFALGSDPRLRRPSVAFANEMFSTLWLPMGACIQLAATLAAFAWLPLMHIFLFRAQVLAQWDDLRNVLQQLKLRFVDRKSRQAR